jgi:hypothetical protein
VGYVSRRFIAVDGHEASVFHNSSPKAVVRWFRRKTVIFPARLEENAFLADAGDLVGTKETWF